jgi:hypothetical protein
MNPLKKMSKAFYISGFKNCALSIKTTSRQSSAPSAALRWKRYRQNGKTCPAMAFDKNNISLPWISLIKD